MSLQTLQQKIEERIRYNAEHGLDKHIVRHGDPVSQAPPPRDIPKVIPAGTPVQMPYNGLFKPIRAGGTDAILAKLFQTLMWNLGFNPNRWALHMRWYVTDPKNGIPNNNKDQSSARGNLSKELLKNRMTWKVFCKGMRFLNRMKFRLILEFPNAKGEYLPLQPNQHGVSVNLGDELNIPNEEESKLING